MTISASSDYTFLKKPVNLEAVGLKIPKKNYWINFRELKSDKKFAS